MVQFRPAAERGRFTPPVVEDFSAAMAQEDQDKLSTFKSFLDQQNEIAQQEVRDAKLPNNFSGLAALAEFSKTAKTELDNYVKRTKKDIEDGQLWAETFEGFQNYEQDLAEEVATEAAQMQLGQVKGQSEALSVDAPNLGYTYYRQNAGIGAGLQNEKALLNKAKSDYTPWLTAFKQSDTLIPLPGGGFMPASQVFRSTDYGILKAGTDYARYQFIKQNNLQYATKRNFSSILSPTLFSTEASSNNNTLSQNIKKEQGDQEAALSANMVNDFMNADGQAAMQEAWNTGSDALYFGNTGLSRAQANAKGTDALIQAALIKGGEEGREILEQGLQILQRPGIEGTQLGGTGSALQIRKAMEQLDKTDRQMGAQQATRLYEQANSVDYGSMQPAAAVSDLRRRAGQIRDIQNGGTTAAGLADKLDRKADSFALGRDVKLGNKDVINNIRAGVNYSNAELQSLLANNVIDGEGLAAARRAQKPEKIPDQSKQYIDNVVGTYSADLSAIAGLTSSVQNDQVVMQGTSKFTALSKDALNGIATQLNSQMRSLASDIYNSLPTSMSEEQREQIVQRELKEWYNANVKNPNGVYNFDALKFVAWDTTTDLDSLKWKQTKVSQEPGLNKQPKLVDLPNAQEKELAENAVDNLKNTSVVQLQRIEEDLRRDNQDVLAPKKFYTSWTPGSPIPPEMKGGNLSLRRGDLVFTLDYTQAAAQKYADTRSFDQEFIDAANGLGKSPLALLTSQVVNRKRQGEMQDFDLGGLLTNSRPRPVSEQISPGQGGSTGPQQLTSYEGMQLLMGPGFGKDGEGFPVPGAAYLSGNIFQESSWIPNKEAWNDVGAPAGGLVSWRATRLEAIEKHFGRPIQDINTMEQLQYMQLELSTNPLYAEAYAIFTDPRSTKRELIYASKQFWGYGDVGNRFQEAQRLIDISRNE